MKSCNRSATRLHRAGTTGHGKIPAFRSEAAEAQWWYEHREVLDRDFEKAAKAGTLKTLTREDLVKRLSASRVISVRLP
jgi:hypothetical protein